MPHNRLSADGLHRRRERGGDTAEIELLLKLVDTEYYVSSDVMGDAMQIGTTRYRWLDSGE